MKKSVLVVSMMAAIAPFGLQALSLTINGNTYPNVDVTSVTTTQAGVTITALDPNNSLGGGGVPPDPQPRDPDAFSFATQPSVALSTLVTSNTVTINGIDTPPSDISVSNGEYRINGGAWTSAAGTIGNGDTVAVRHTSAASNSTQTTTTLTIGGVSGLFRSTTAAAVGACGDIPPNIEFHPELNWASPGGTQTIHLKNQIKSVPFVATQNSDYAGRVSVVDTYSRNDTTREVWVSTCPTASYEETNSNCKRRTATSVNISWAQKEGVLFHCALTPGAQYYINIRNVDCSRTSCPVNMIIYNNGNP